MTQYTSVAREIITRAIPPANQYELPGLPLKRHAHSGGRQLRRAIAEDVITIRQCEVELRDILQRIKKAGAVRSVEQLRSTIRSVGGAGRHAYSALTDKEMARYLTWVHTSQLPAPEAETTTPEDE